METNSSQYHRICPNCGATVGASANFCGSCATPIATTSESIWSGKAPVIAGIGLAGIILIAGFVFAVVYSSSGGENSNSVQTPPVVGSASELTRTSIALLINGSKEFSQSRTVIRLNDKGFTKGLKQGMWDEQKKLTSRGETVFKSSTPVISRGLLSNCDNKCITLKDSVDVDLQVTGITDAVIGQGIKEAQFTWTYANLPPLVKRYVVAGGGGIAYLRHYDDGWRLDELRVAFSPEPAPQSQAEVAQEETDEREEEARLSKLKTDSKTPTHEQGTFYFEWLPGPALYRSVPPRTRLTVRISDVDIECTQIDIPGDAPPEHQGTEKTYTIWFGDVKDITTASQWIKFKQRRQRGHYEQWGDVNWYAGNEADRFYQGLSSAHSRWLEKFKEVVERNLH